MNKELEIVNNTKYSCSICGLNEAIMEIRSSVLKMEGKYCESCAIVRIQQSHSWNSEKESEIKSQRMKSYYGWKK